MKLIAILIALLVVGLLASKQLKTTVTVPTVSVPGQPGGEPIKAQSPKELVNAVGTVANQAVQAGAQETADKLKAAEAATK
jgi:hypothetical protein